MNISRRRFCLGVWAPLAVQSPIENAMNDIRTSGGQRVPSLTDVEGLLVGHFTRTDRPTGCTVITSAAPFVAGIDVRGGAPGSYDTELLRSEKTVDRVNAIFLAGGSAFGLAVGPGVARYLEEQGLGYAVGKLRVPIVCGAILFDLLLGDARVRPDADAGYAACKAASSSAVREGNVGAGAGATVGKFMGPEFAMKGGLGSWAVRGVDGIHVGAIAAVNAVGNVRDPSTGRIIAGTRRPDGTGFFDIAAEIRAGRLSAARKPDSTLLGVVATNAVLTKTQCNQVAQMSHDALARCIHPSHLPSDGDTVFAVSTGRWTAGNNPVDVGRIGTLAAEALAVAIVRAVQQAETWGPYPAARDFQPRPG